MLSRVAAIACVFALSSSTVEAQFNVSDPAPGEDFHVELGAMFWSPEPSLILQTGALAAFGDTRVDFVREFGIEEKRFREFRFVAKAGRKHKIRFNYLPLEYNQTATLQRTVTFGDQVFTEAVPTTADLEWKMWKIGYEWDIVARDRGFFGVIAELKHNEINASLSNTFGTQTEEAKAPIPTFGVIGRGYPHRLLSITGEFTGFKIPDRLSEELDASIYDFDIYATLSLGRNFGVQGGYRSLTADYLVDDDAGELELKGPYFGGVLRF